MRLPNDTKIRFCNAVDALKRHAEDCQACREYTHCGDGDLCDKGKEIIAQELAYADTTIQFAQSHEEGKLTGQKGKV